MSDTRALDTKVLRLKIDITNPRPDRRSRDWHKLPVLKAGERFLARREYMQHAGQRYGWVPRNDELAKLVEANSEEVTPDTVKELLYVHDCDWGGDEVLRILLKLGKIKPEDFAEVGKVPEDF